MKHVSHLLIRFALGRGSSSMALLLMISLLLALIQSSASQLYVNSSSYDVGTRTPALEQANQTQESLRPSRPIDWTEVPDQIMGLRAKTERVPDRNTSVGVYEQKDNISSVQLEALNNTVEETSTKPTKMHMKVYLTAHSPSPNSRTKGGPSQTQHSTVRPVTTVPTQKTRGYSEKETATFTPTKQDSGGTTLAETMPTKAITNTSKESWSVSAVLLPTVISSVKSSTDSNDANQDQTSHTFLTTVSTTHIKPTVGLVLQDKASTARLTNKKPSTSVHSPVFADRLNTSGLGGG